MAYNATYSIGGLGVTLTGGPTCRLATELPGMAPFGTEQPQGDGITVRLDEQVSAAPVGRWLYRFNGVGGPTDGAFGVDADGVCYFRWGCGLALRYDPRTPHMVAMGTSDDASLVRFALWCAYTMAALPRGVVALHASAAVCRDRAVLCLGESGTGKSTHTRLWVETFEGCRLLNDDSPLLRFDDGVLTAYGSPWSGKTPVYRPERVPVAALLRIVQMPRNSMHRLGTVAALAAVQPSCPPALAHDERMMDTLLDFAGHMVLKVPVYRLECRPDTEAARLSHDTIFPAL